MKILVADDEPISLKVVSNMLARYGDCTEVTSGTDAFEEFQLAWEAGNPFGLVCLDVMMPGLSGLEVLKLIREFELANEILPQEQVKVIVATGIDSVEGVLQAITAGSSWYLVKPIDPKIFSELMDDLEIPPLNR